jgi:hypothetical protein
MTTYGKTPCEISSSEFAQKELHADKLDPCGERPHESFILSVLIGLETGFFTFNPTEPNPTVPKAT